MNILFTSVGRRSYLVKYFQEVLNGKGEVHVANSSEISPAFNVADKSVVTPLIYDNSYISFLKSYCVENKINAIISLFDIDLPVLAKHKKEFMDIGVTVVVSDYSSVEICNDKWKTYQFLLANGFDTPKTFISVDKALKSVASGEVSFPLMIKPRWGMGSIAVYEAETEEELKVFYKKTKRNIEKTYLKYESSADIDNSILIQEKLSGQEYGLDIINDLDGNYVTTIPKMKYAMRSGETDCAVTVDCPKLKELGRKLSGAVHHIANLDTDVFVKDEKCYVLEMNARFGGGYPFSHMAGVNLPSAIVKWLSGESVDTQLLTERVNIMSHKDISMVRLYLKPNIGIKRISDLNKTKELVLEFEKLLSPTLSERKIDVEAYAQRLFQNGRLYAAFNDEGKCMGILAAYMNDKEKKAAYITMFAVSPQYRGLKVGEQLIHTAEKDAKESGMKCSVLEVRKNNSNAIGFYRAFGYQNIGDASDTSLYMSKKL
ncbi:MAG: GNAT family N-acetyltransferase [Acutalibacteraceae bacterium]